MYCKSVEQNKKIAAIDFFCGCGGVTHGFIAAGINVVAGLDNDLSARFAFEINNKPAKFYHVDINKTQENTKIVTDILKNENNIEITIFSACAPCQPFSLHNKKHKGDRRKSLMLKFIGVVSNLPKNCQPDVIFAENVGTMKKRGSIVLKKALKILDILGYAYLEPRVINAKNYGVPQNRKRLIFIAVKRNKLVNNDIFNWEYFQRKYSENKISVKMAIKNLPKIPHNHKINNDDALHITRRLSDDNLRKLMKITTPGCGKEMWDSSDILQCHKNHNGHKDVYGRMSWDESAPTLTCKCVSISNGRFGHPEQHRAISLREAAILQTMDHYKFEEPIIINKVAQQIGNAVPPKLARKFGEYILELFNTNPLVDNSC